MATSPGAGRVYTLPTSSALAVASSSGTRIRRWTASDVSVPDGRRQTWRGMSRRKNQRSGTPMPSSRQEREGPEEYPCRRPSTAVAPTKKLLRAVVARLLARKP